MYVVGPTTKTIDPMALSLHRFQDPESVIAGVLPIFNIRIYILPALSFAASLIESTGYVEVWFSGQPKLLGENCTITQAHYVL